jgi:son of sevenless
MNTAVMLLRFSLCIGHLYPCAIDPAFIKTFLMTYKSFTTLDELFDLLVQRFWIQPPPNLTPPQLAEWKKLKQHIIQMRLVYCMRSLRRQLTAFFSVLNTFKSMVVDDDVLEKEDLYILDRMKEFISNEEVIRFAAAKQLMIFIERAVSAWTTNCPSFSLTLCSSNGEAMPSR